MPKSVGKHDVARMKWLEGTHFHGISRESSSQDVSITAVFSGHYVKTQQTEKTGEDFEFRLRGNTGLNGETMRC